MNEFVDVEKRRWPKVALVVGIAGIVGRSLANLNLKPHSPRDPWKVYGVARMARPKWFVNTQIDYVQCDVLDKTDAHTMISPLKDVTHLFSVIWVHCGSEEINCLPNTQLAAHVLQTGAKHYLVQVARQPFPNFYYTLEDLLFLIVKRKDVNLTWFIHRPNVIFGFCPCNLINILRSLVVYACICKQEGLPSLFLGDSTYLEQFGDVSNPDLVVEQELWAALNSNVKNQVFNIFDGDVFNYKRVWSHLAEQFDIDVLDYSGQLASLSKAMKAKGAVWDAIIQKHGLVPTKFGKIVN
ncbi:hypothetical protein L7F22_015554 [Adiantum nelumboides]|nr:hypothetical protein [Adiantum nelumboides]